MDVAKKIAGRTWRHFMGDSLYRNSIFLMANTIALAGFGFLFWVVATHFYSTGDIGLAATILSIAGLISTLGMLGFDSALIHFLPTSKKIPDQINTSFTAACIGSLLISCAYLVIIKLYIPKLGFLEESFGWAATFIFFMVTFMLNSLTNNVFVAFRSSHLILIVNILFGVLRLGGVVAFTRLNLSGLILANVIATVIAIGLTFYLLKVKVHYTYRPRISLESFRQMRRYAFGNYLFTVISNLPILLLPTIVVSLLGPKESAYFYIVTVIAGVLYVIPAATAQSLFAEGSFDNQGLKSHLIKAFKISYALTLPVVAVLIAAGHLILSIFGHEYATQGYMLLVLMALAAIPKVINGHLSSLLRVHRNLRPIIIVYAVYAALILGGSFLGLHQGHSLAIVGITMIGGEIIASILYVALLFKRMRRPLAPNHL